ncbi:MAG: hypothetical protein Q9185_005957 [Variospora sp. 1 TL-2023]
MTSITTAALSLNDADPTEGYVDYVDGQSSGLFSQSGGSVQLSVDSTSVASGRGRKSVRLTSKASYNHALIVIDIAHMPANICGVWPAFWTTGPNWPSSGEIDIVEGVNTQSTNKITLHSDPGIYGASINSGGAVYALEWTSDGMSVWGWSSGDAPSDASGSNPDPSSWGNPTASFPSSSSCDVDTFFKDQQIVFDTTFCGVWAGETWSSDPECSGLAATCQEYVQNNPSAFEDAYWTINSLKVYTDGDGSSSSGSTTGNGGTDAGGTESVVNPVPSDPPASPAPEDGVEVSEPATTAIAPTDPIPTRRPGRGGGWGGGRNGGGGGGRGGRGSRGRARKIRRRIRGSHMKHLVIETWDEPNERGQSYIIDSGVPELGEELKM